MTRRILALCAFAIALPACTKTTTTTVQREAPIRASATPAPAATGAAQAPAAKPVSGGSLDATACPPPLAQKTAPTNASVVLQLAKTTFERNEPVALRLTLTNKGPENLRRRWGKDQPDWDVWVSLNGQVVWRSFHASDTRGAAGDRVYAPGEDRQQDETWPNQYCKGDSKQQRDRVPGTYTAQGYFADFDGAWYTNAIEFQVK